MEDLELRRTDSEILEEDEVSLEAQAVRITRQELEDILTSLEDKDYIPSYELQGTILLDSEGDLCVIAKGKNNKFNLIYI